jgi:hypothetical protein
MAEPSKRDIVKWIKALRSGKFKQGRGQLQSKKGFCCLGVACQINKFEKKVKKDGTLAGLMPGSMFQPNAPEWLLKVNDNFARKAMINLWVLNDGLKGDAYSSSTPRYTFDEIADLLQAVYIEGVLDAE